MKVLIYAEQQDGQLKKSAFEAVSFAVQTWAPHGVQDFTVVMGGRVSEQDAAGLGSYGATQVLMPEDGSLDAFEPHVHAAILLDTLQKSGADLLVMAHTYAGKSLVPRLAVSWQATLAAAVNHPPEIQADGTWTDHRLPIERKAEA